VRVGLVHPSKLLVRTCQSHVRAHDYGAITTEELCVSLFDFFIHAHNEGLVSAWGPALDSLPLTLQKDFLAYAARSEPRLFAPLPSSRQEKEQAEAAARAAQAELVARLEAKCGGVG
jgi:hypothetical protein